MWFYEESECTRIAKKLELLVKGESTRQQPKAQAKADVDILSLLTKAHGEYEQVNCIWLWRIFFVIAFISYLRNWFDKAILISCWLIFERKGKVAMPHQCPRLAASTSFAQQQSVLLLTVSIIQRRWLSPICFLQRKRWDLSQCLSIQVDLCLNVYLSCRSGHRRACHHLICQIQNSIRLKILNENYGGKSRYSQLLAINLMRF